MGLSPEQMQDRMGRWWGWHAQMEKDGVVKGGHALTAPVRHISGPERTVTDRTSVELKEVVGGYYIVTAEDLAGASEIAQGYPDYDLGGTCEVREVMVFEQ